MNLIEMFEIVGRKSDRQPVHSIPNKQISQSQFPFYPVISQMPVGASRWELDFSPAKKRPALDRRQPWLVKMRTPAPIPTAPSWLARKNQMNI
jgi:hypothetical protein